MATNFSKKDMIKLQNLLRKSKKTITTAESCTGGLVASIITKISGSIDIFNGSIVTYSNSIKNKELDVLNESLDKFGAVSKQVVSEMLDGVLKKFEADFAIAISGIAGPNGGTKNKPVGTIVIGIASNNNIKKIKTYHLKGSRISIQKQSANIALSKILKFVSKTIDN